MVLALPWWNDFTSWSTNWSRKVALNLAKQPCVGCSRAVPLEGTFWSQWFQLPDRQPRSSLRVLLDRRMPRSLLFCLRCWAAPVVVIWSGEEAWVRWSVRRSSSPTRTNTSVFMRDLAWSSSVEFVESFVEHVGLFFVARRRPEVHHWCANQQRLLHPPVARWRRGLSHVVMRQTDLPRPPISRMFIAAVDSEMATDLLWTPASLRQEAEYSGRVLSWRRLAPDSLIFPVPTILSMVFTWAMSFCQDVTDRAALAGGPDARLCVCRAVSEPRASDAGMLTTSVFWRPALSVLVSFLGGPSREWRGVDVHDMPFCKWKREPLGVWRVSVHQMLHWFGQQDCSNSCGSSDDPHTETNQWQGNETCQQARVGLASESLQRAVDAWCWSQVCANILPCVGRSVVDCTVGAERFCSSRQDRSSRER